MTQFEVQNVSKLYRRGQLNSGSFKQDMVHWWNSTVLRRENPYYKIADSNEDGPYFWALKDVNFSVNEGEMFAVVGKNGSGKSTLLKIICRITSPTTGSVRGRGRISSMLEVGTGFSPDLTGRQNIFLSGHILGMSRREVTQKFDEIVAFSGVEAFIDTPVKRYSSGMYVRLAFSVAAHLDSDIMIIDEVLAVGDAEFQEKCLMKMNEITRQSGRTVLLVTHNMQPVKRLCSRALWIDKGKVMSVGAADEVVRSYMTTLGYGEQVQSFDTAVAAPGNEWIRMKSAEVHDGERRKSTFKEDEVVHIRFNYWCFAEGEVEVLMGLYTEDGICVCEVPSSTLQATKEMQFECAIPKNFLTSIPYCIQFRVFRGGSAVPLAEFPYALYFQVKSGSKLLSTRKNEGLLHAPFAGELNNVTAKRSVDD